MPRKNEPKWLIIHHTGGTDLDPLADTSHHTFEIVGSLIEEKFGGWHKYLWHFRSRMGYYIGYHYFIEKDGKTRQGRYDWEEGAHCRGMNTSSIGICLAGNFDRPIGSKNCYPTKEQEKALKNLLERLTKKYNIPPERIVPHRHFTFKTCYGKNLPDDWARNLIKKKQLKKEEIKRKIALLQKIIRLLQQLMILRIKIQNKITGIFSRDPYK